MTSGDEYVDDPVESGDGRGALIARALEYLENAGGSLVYCLSAMLILLGMYKLIAPILAQSEQVWELIRSVSAMAVYELALLAVLVFVARFRRVFDDAVSLVLLVAVFITAGGIAVDTMAVTGPTQSMWFGVVCLGLGLVKLGVLRGVVGVKLDTGLVSGLGVLLAWNYLVSPFLARAQLRPGMDADALRLIWQKGGVLLLLGFIPVTMTVLRRSRFDVSERPFLRTSVMSWLFALVLAAGAGIHQYSAAYAFGIDTLFGDYLLLLSLTALCITEVAGACGVPGAVQRAVSFLPLALAVLVIAAGGYNETCAPGLGLVGYPPAVIIISLAWLVARSAVCRDGLHKHAILAYALGAVWTWGIGPGESVGDMNWVPLLSAVALYFVVLAIVRNDVDLAIAGLLAGTSAAVAAHGAGAILANSQISSMDLAGLLLGFGMILISLLFGRATPELIVLGGVLALACGISGISASLPQASVQFLAFATAALSFAVWLCTRYKSPLIAGLVPALQAVHPVFSISSGWLLVLGSFVLLAVGTWMSLRKSTRRIAQ